MIHTFLIYLLSITFANSPIQEKVPASADGGVQWYSWEEAVEANKTKPKKFVIDLYTHWCGWCKVMDKKTFSDAQVAAFMNEHFYPIKFNAEQKEEILWNNYTFKHLEGGRNGIHELAYSLMEGKASYPTLVYLDENFNRIMISPGYKQPDQLMKELRYTNEEAYKTTKFEEFQ